MIKNLLVKILLGKPLDPENQVHRTRLGIGAGVLGIILNVSMTVFKIVIGTITGSVSIVADGVNNLTDSLASIVTTVGIVFSGMPSDEKHPYGHGRLEYLIALIISIGVFLAGGMILKSSVEGIINPKVIEFNTLAVSMLGISIAIKYLMYRSYTDIGKTIDSAPLKAAALDSIGDVGITVVVLIAYLGSVYTDFPIDGIGSLIVSLLILKGGWDMIREMTSELLGEGLDPDSEKRVLKYFDREDIIGVHDLNAHNYGPGVIYATIDAIVSEDMSATDIYKTFNEIEQQVLNDLGMFLTIRVDIPTEEIPITKYLDKFVSEVPGVLSYHDEDLIYTKNSKRFVIHLKVDGNIIVDYEDEEELKQKLKNYISGRVPKENYRITIDKYYQD